MTAGLFLSEFLAKKPEERVPLEMALNINFDSEVYINYGVNNGHNKQKPYPLVLGKAATNEQFVHDK